MVGGSVTLKNMTKMLKQSLPFLKKMLKQSLPFLKSSSFMNDGDDGDRDITSLSLPRDVKKGHFAVHSTDEGRQRRFIVKLRYLTNAGFVKLLEQAEEEFGFGQGDLCVPCRSTDLEKILENGKDC